MHANPRDAIGKKSDEVIGKTMAERATKEPTGKFQARISRSAGSMKGFYDKILPDFHETSTQEVGRESRRNRINRWN